MWVNEQFQDEGKVSLEPAPWAVLFVNFVYHEAMMQGEFFHQTSEYKVLIRESR